MMSPNLFYQDFLLCIGVASLIFGLFLLFFKAPANNIYQPYRRSKSLLAAGYLVMSLNIMFWGITFDDRFTKPDVLDIYNEIIAIYLLYIIFNYALCNLLDHHYLTRRRLLTDAFRWVGVIAISALSMLPLFEKIRWGIAAFISFLLIEYIVSFLYKFRKLYLHNDKVMANYFADDKRRFVAWTNRLILLMVVYGLLAFISIFRVNMVQLLIPMLCFGLQFLRCHQFPESLSALWRHRKSLYGMGRTGEVRLSAGNNPQQSGVSPVGEQTESLGCAGEIYRAQPYPRFSFHLCGNQPHLSLTLSQGDSWREFQRVGFGLACVEGQGADAEESQGQTRKRGLSLGILFSLLFF